MELVPRFEAILQPFALAMTPPTFRDFLTVVVGWSLAGRRTVMRMILVGGDSADKH